MGVALIVMSTGEPNVWSRWVADVEGSLELTKVRALIDTGVVDNDIRRKDAASLQYQH
jgi:hypothetical protein